MAAVGRTLVASRERSDAAVAVFAIVSLVWIGALLGVSFLATPVKFLAPSLTLPVALDVGRQTFHWYNRLELVFAALALASAAWWETPWRRLAARERRGASGAPSSAGIATPPYGTLLAAFLTAAVALQGAVLLPLLDARVEIILQGGTPPESVLHDVYVIVEAAKLGALVGAAWLAVGQLRRGAGADR